MVFCYDSLSGQRQNVYAYYGHGALQTSFSLISNPVRQVQNTPVLRGTKTEAEKQLSSCSKVMGLKVALDPNLSFIDFKIYT